MIDAPLLAAGAAPALPRHGIDAYRATLRTMAAIEAGGSDEDDRDFRRLVASIGETARRGDDTRPGGDTIAAAIARLGSAEQIILQLSLVENCSLAEIANILDLPPPDIARIRRAAIGRVRSDLVASTPG
jgi:DNA-directed RNA polymerase specialized sigma subunit